MTDTSEPGGIDWEQRFQDETTPWERPDLHPALALWEKSDVFQVGKRGIIPGCGRAPELLHLARLDMHMTGADLSETAIDWQKKQMGQAGLTADLLTGDVFKHRPSQAYDFVWEQTFLCAIPPSLRTLYETSAHAWLKSGGQFLALFMQKGEQGGPPYGCSLDAMEKLFPQDRWIWPSHDSFVPFPHPNLEDLPELAGILTRR
jgi:hypothetical protein